LSCAIQAENLKLKWQNRRMAEGLIHRSKYCAYCQDYQHDPECPIGIAEQVLDGEV
jgi:hypothetical protein